MKNANLFARPFFASLVLLLSLFMVACGNDKGKVEEVNKLYGTDSKVWKTAKLTDAAGDKVKQTDAQEQEELHVYADGKYTMTGASGAVSGKYSFDQAAKVITLTPEGSATSNTFNVETLTDDKLTLVAPTGAKLMLEKQ